MRTPDIMAAGMTRRLLGGAFQAVTLTAGVARHVAWYLNYQMDGNARDDDLGRKLRRPPA